MALAKTGSDQLRRLTRIRIGTRTFALCSCLSVLITAETEGQGEGRGGSKQRIPRPKKVVGCVELTEIDTDLISRMG